MNDVLSQMSDEDFVERCYRNFLKRPSDAGGKDHYVQALGQGLSRTALIEKMVAGEEFRQLLAAGRILLAEGDSPFLRFSQPGNYDSPLPAIAEVRKNYEAMALPEPDARSGIDLDPEGQLALLNEFKAYYGQLPFSAVPKDGIRYHYENGSFVYFDAIMLYFVLRHFKPQRIVEVGSGFSSAVMLDTNEIFFQNRMELTFIEPYPVHLYKVMRPPDRVRHPVIEKPVQEVGLDLFDTLGANDILFVDSSHVVKFGSDVVHILFHVLPRLASGVLVHFHDIFRNFDYPRQWLEEGRAWNEGYFVRAFLSFNRDFRILLFNDYLAGQHWDFLSRNLPLCTAQPQGSPFANAGVSLWLQRAAGSYLS